MTSSTVSRSSSYTLVQTDREALPVVTVEDVRRTPIEPDIKKPSKREKVSPPTSI